MRTEPFFFDRVPHARRPAYPRVRGEQRAGIVVVGGGLAGTACAAALASAGADVLLLEAGRVGAGTTSATAGLLRHDFDTTFQEAAAAYGLKAARHMWQANRRASLDFAAALRRLRIKCDLAPQDVLAIARTADDVARRLRRDYAARRDAGVEATWLTAKAIARDTAVEAAGGIRSGGEAIDPYRAALGLAAAASARGARIYERSEATRIRAGRKAVEIRTDAARITAETVVIATSVVPADLRALKRHFTAADRYAVVTAPLPGAVRRQVGSRRMALDDRAEHAHLLRWTSDDRAWFSGAERAAQPQRSRDAATVANAMELMYELSTIYPAISGVQPEWAWAYTRHASRDGLPVVGTHRNFPRHLFALGLESAGAAWLAARIIARHVAGEPVKGDEVFGFGRLL